jgi:hypothetical protein
MMVGCWVLIAYFKKWLKKPPVGGPAGSSDRTPPLCLLGPAPTGLFCNGISQCEMKVRKLTNFLIQEACTMDFHVNAHRAAIVGGGASRRFAKPSTRRFVKEMAHMKKLLAVLMAGLFAAGAFAQAPATAPAPAPAPAAAPQAAPAPAAAPAAKATKAAKAPAAAKHKKVAPKKTRKPVKKAV